MEAAATPVINWNDVKELIRETWEQHLSNRKDQHRLHIFLGRAKSFTYEQKVEEGKLSFIFLEKYLRTNPQFMGPLFASGLVAKVELYGMTSHDQIFLTINDLTDLDGPTAPERFTVESLTFVEDFEP